MKKENIAFIGGRGYFSNYGGVENATREISLELAKKNLNIIIYGVKESTQNLVAKNITTLGCPKFIYNLFGQHGLILFSVLHAIFFSRPKVVYLFASGPCIFTPLLRLGGLKVVTSLRAIDSARDKWGRVSRSILKVGEYCAWRYSNTFTVNSKEMVEYYNNKRADVVFIPNGSKLDNSSAYNIPKEIESKQYFLFAARFDPVKRLHLLLEAYSDLEGDDPPLLVIAGGNSKDADYEKQLRKFESDMVIFLGHVSQHELAPIMANCKAFILPSILEGMSNSLLSAMINGKPVLAADVPANSDLLDNDDAVFKADDVDALKIGLNKLSIDDDFCLTLGRNLQKRAASSYTWESTADKFYEAAVGSL